MTDEQPEPVSTSLAGTLFEEQANLGQRQELIPMPGASCELDEEGHCVTCADEALPARVLHVDQETGLAQVAVKDTTEEIDITLVESVVPGDLLLVHGGVAIGHL